MAAIGKIRQRSGLLIVIIGVALAAFILTDLFKNMGQGQMQYDPTVIAFINEEKVPSREFSNRVEELTENYMRQQQKKDVTNEERYNIQLQAWELMKNETVLNQECIKIGLLQDNGVDPRPSLSTEEYAQLLQGSNPHPFIEQNFKGQNGQFDPTLISRFLSGVEAGLNSENPKDREEAQTSQEQWDYLEKLVKSDQISTKYFNLITKGYFMPKTIAAEKYHDRNDSRNVRFVGVRYGLINDSLVEPTDADYEAYYEEHKHEFKNKEEKRSLDYVIWNVKPSEEDINDISENLNEIETELRSLPLKEVPAFVNRNSDNPYDSTWRKRGTLSPYIDSLAFSSEPGTIFNVWRENNQFHLGRLMDVQMRPDSMRASHILISYAGAFQAGEDITRTKIGASALADSLMDVAKKDKNRFGDLAFEYSEGPSGKQSRGDLDWFPDGGMLPQFNQACLDNEVGDIVKVETVYGYHIIHITGKKDPVKKVRVAQIDVPILHSQKTYEKVFNEASQFVSRARDAEAFDTVSVNMGLNVMQSNELTQMSNGLLGIDGSRKIVQWLYGEKTEVGSVSDVFDFDDKVVVCLYKSQNPKGIRPLDDDLKEFIKVLVMRDLKNQMLQEKYADVKTLEEVASRAASKVDTMDFMTFAAYRLGEYGPEPSVLGSMLASPLNTFTGPIKGDQGIYFYVVDAEQKAEAPKDGYRFIAEQEINQYRQALNKDYNNSNPALKAVVEESEIEDYRHFFY